MFKLLAFFVLIFAVHISMAQASFPMQRFVDWQHSGSKSIDESQFLFFDLATLGIDTTGQLDCSLLLNQIIQDHSNEAILLHFPKGQFKIAHPVNLKAQVIIEGMGMGLTHLNFALGNIGSSFQAQGNLSGNPIALALNVNGVKGQKKFICPGHHYQVGDWLRITGNDTLLMTSSWAYGTAGQLIQIKSIDQDTLFLASALRRSYLSDGYISIQKIEPQSEIIIRCLSIHRQDDTAPAQESNIQFQGVVHALISGVAFFNCTFAHIDLRTCSNITIRNCFFKDGFTYGGGGRAYGVALQATSNECLIEDNIFQHLRHSILLQSGANGNVAAFNFSTEPYWEEASFPANSSGEIVLHGNYPYANLFEQNVIGNIVIDNSHGANGPNNLFYRNRAERYGIFFSDQTSPSQLFIGNHITNTSLPYSLVNYNILGTGHYQFANNNKGSIVPSGTYFTTDTSFAYPTRPNFVPAALWLTIGDQPVLLQNIPAQKRFIDGTFMINSCQLTNAQQNIEQKYLELEPNPCQDICRIIVTDPSCQRFTLTDQTGKILKILEPKDTVINLDMSCFQSGIYFLRLENGEVVEKLLKF